MKLFTALLAVLAFEPGVVQRSGVARRDMLILRTCFRAIDRVAHVRRREAVAALERAIEVRQVAKTGVKCDRRDVAIAPAWRHQHPARTLEAATKNELRE